MEELTQEHTAKNVNDVERLASILIGSFFLLRIFHKGFLSPGTKVGLGAFFLQRGLSGKCPLYNYLEFSTKKEEEGLKEGDKVLVVGY